MAKFFSPLWVKVSAKRKFILNMNQYRNAHYRVSNKAKIEYKEFIKQQILKRKKKFGKMCIIYTVYQPTRRRFDIGNVCSIHQKFFEDALVELGRLDDDRYNYIPMCVFCFGGIDPSNPRVDIEIIEESKSFFTKLNTTLDNIIKRLYNRDREEN